LAWCETGAAGLLDSFALRYELAHNPHPLRRAFVQETLDKAVSMIRLSSPVEHRARNYAANGVKPLDALHLACAVESAADYFCTCDDRLLRRARQLQTAPTGVVSPLELIERLEP
jgi:predicted nucleic acid-binding protein